MRVASLATDRPIGVAGFTLLELVVTITIAGIVMAFVAARFVGISTFQSRGFFDQATETIRYAQKTSIAWRQQIFVCVTASSITASADAACLVPLTGPGGSALAATAPTGVTLAGAGFSFAAPTATTAGGRPTPDAQVTITVNSTVPGDPARQIVVERETGYVHN